MKLNELEQAIEYAQQRAIEEGYDQLIFRNKKKGYGVKRVTKDVRPIKLVGFVRLFYKDHTLYSKYMEATV